MARSIAFTLIFLLAPGLAASSPLENSTGTEVFTGPSHPHATSIYLNPAALALARRGQHLFIGGAFRLSQISVDKQIFDDQGDQFAAGPTIKDSLVAPGGLVGFYTSVADRGYFGVALHAPFWEEFPGEDSALRYHSNGGRQWQTLFSMAGAFRANSRFLFGLGLSVSFTQLNLNFSRDSALEAGRGATRGTASDCSGARCGVENPEARQDYQFDVGTPGLRGLFATQNLGLSLGLSYRPYGNWWLSLAFLSPPGSIKSLALGGRVQVNEAPRDGGQIANGRGEISFDMPPSLTLGVVGPISDHLNLVADIRWLNSSRHSQYDIRLFGGDLNTLEDVPEWYPRYRGFVDTWRFQVGLEGREEQRIRLGGRLRYETGAVDVSTVTPLQIHGQHLGAALSVGFRLTETLIVTAGYNVSWFPKIRANRSVFDPRDRLDCVDSNFDINRCDGAREGRALPTANGNYQKFEHALSLSIQYDRF